MCLYSTEIIPSSAADVAVKYYAIAILIFQWITAILLLLTGIKAYIVISGFILIAGIALFVLFRCKANAIFSSNIVTEIEILVERKYIHPLDS